MRDGLDIQCGENGCWGFQVKDHGARIAAQKEKGRPKSKFMGAVKRSHADCWHYEVNCKGQEENQNE